MSNFKMNFSHPWLLLLLIPALVVTFIPYFRLAKKYRRNRNRVTSVVLHTIISVLCVTVLAGLTFSYQVPNTSNEVLLLVDMSHSSSPDANFEEERDNFVKSVLNASSSRYKLGIVTFGYDQVYAAELSNDTDEVYDNYIRAKRPDDSATDIASALGYARTLFKTPKTAKIVLVTDGAETDGSANDIVMSLAAEGIKVDTVYLGQKREGNEVQLLGADAPDYNILVGDTFKLELTVQSSIACDAEISLYDNGEKTSSDIKAELAAGVQKIEIEHAFELPGMHELRFEINSGSDTIDKNNNYYSYIYLRVYDKMLIVERTTSEAQAFEQLLIDNQFNVDVVAASDAAAMPSTLEELREYDQVILSNIANADMPEGFDELLYSYVHDIGGGLLTVGGNRLNEHGETVANAYNRADMIGTLYQQMLPVQAIDYSPPLGVVIIIDRSGSMGDGSDGTALDLAKKGAMSCLNALKDYDFCGIMTLETTYSEELSITPMTQKNKIIAAIDDIKMGGGTTYTNAIDRAGRALIAQTGVERRHIILVSDGQPGDDYEKYGAAIRHNYETGGITYSLVVIGDRPSAEAELRKSAEEDGHGKYYYAPKGDDSILGTMREDLKVPDITEVTEGEFTPELRGHSSVVSGLDQKDMPKLYGYYGTRLKDGAEAPLMGEYVPIYAQWKFGKGTVGSFMCDLQGGKWSGEFMQSPSGARFLLNAVNALFPTGDIRDHDIELDLYEDNYSTNISIYTDLEQGQSIKVEVTEPEGLNGEPASVFTMQAGATDNYSRMIFKNRRPGIHEVKVTKLDADGNSISQRTTYRAFSYSKEYDMFTDTEQCRLFLSELAENGDGITVDVNDPWQIFDETVKALDRSFDPRFVFIITALVLFLLDVAVRKFKFKWIHEIIRERKAAKAEALEK